MSTVAIQRIESFLPVIVNGQPTVPPRHLILLILNAQNAMGTEVGGQIQFEFEAGADVRNLARIAVEQWTATEPLLENDPPEIILFPDMTTV